MKKLIIIALLLQISVITYAQDDKTVTLVVSGSGKTLEDAKQSALRGATEQAFGAFISTKTEMFNDQLVADQMASVSSGNIKSYEVLNESQLPNGSWGVTLKAIVSVSKLTSFVESKGIEIEFKGALFVINIKQQLLNEQAEIKAVSELVGLLHEPMQISFDYTIKSGEPKSLDLESENWEIPLEVSAKANKNMDFCANYCVKTLSALSLSAEDISSYKSLNKPVFIVNINYKGTTKKIYLRKDTSIYVLKKYLSNWEFYTRLFTVKSEMGESNGNGVGKIHEFRSKLNNNNMEVNISFLTNGQLAATFNWKENRTLAQISQLNGYKIKARGIISDFKNGGYVLRLDNNKFLIVSLIDRVADNWNQIEEFYDKYNYNGYSDWRLPTEEELFFIDNSFKSENNLGSLLNLDSYWYIGSNQKKYIRPVRSIPTLGNIEAKELTTENYRIKYPIMAREYNIKGNVTISYIISIDGIAKDFKIIKGIGAGCDEEVIKFLQMKKWHPKVINGKPVEDKKDFTFEFQLY
jgi:hypothetical protein